MSNQQSNDEKKLSLSESRADLVIGVFILVFSLILLYVLIPWQIPDAGKPFPNPRSLPRFYGYSLLVLSLCMLYSAYQKRSTGVPQDVIFTLRGVKIVVITMLILAANILLLKYIPYIPVTFLLLFSLMWLFGQRNKIILLSISIGMPVLIYLFFTHLLKLVLP